MNYRHTIKHFYHKFFKKDLWLKVCLIVATLLVVFELVVVFANNQSSSALDLQTYAMRVVNDCKGASYRPTCYEDKIPQLMDRITMEDAFKVTRVVQSIDTTYRYCHVLGHKLASRETAKDPIEWKSVMARCPFGQCSNGCIHGAFQERFRKEYLSHLELEQVKKEFVDVCEPRDGFNPTGLEKGSCYHALGHLTMYVTSADVKSSLALCKEFAHGNGTDWSQLCFDGVFMQIYQPLEPDDFSLIEGKEIKTQDQHKQFCDQFSGKQRSSCWTEGWPLYRDEIKTPQGLENFCNYLAGDATEHKRCFTALYYVLTAQFDLDQNTVTKFCSGMSKNWRGRCFANAASRFIETDYENVLPAVALCKTAAQFGNEKECFTELDFYADYNFGKTNPARAGLCEAIPDKYKLKCKK